MHAKFGLCGGLLDIDIDDTRKIKRLMIRNADRDWVHRREQTLLIQAVALLSFLLIVLLCYTISLRTELVVEQRRLEIQATTQESCWQHVVQGANTARESAASDEMMKLKEHLLSTQQRLGNETVALAVCEARASATHIANVRLEAYLSSTQQRLVNETVAFAVCKFRENITSVENAGLRKDLLSTQQRLGNETVALAVCEARANATHVKNVRLEAYLSSTQQRLVNETVALAVCKIRLNATSVDNVKLNLTLSKKQQELDAKRNASAISVTLESGITKFGDPIQVISSSGEVGYFKRQLQFKDSIEIGFTSLMSFSTDWNCRNMRVGEAAGSMNFRLSRRSYTVSTWIKIVSMQNEIPVVGQANNLGRNQCLHLVVRKGRAFMSHLKSDLHGRQLLAEGIWYHLIYSYDIEAKTFSIYVDGKLDSREYNIDPLISTQEILIGQWSNYVGFNGALAELRVWAGAVDEKAAKLLYGTGNSNLSPLGSGSFLNYTAYDFGLTQKLRSTRNHKLPGIFWGNNGTVGSSDQKLVSLQARASRSFKSGDVVAILVDCRQFAEMKFYRNNELVYTLPLNGAFERANLTPAVYVESKRVMVVSPRENSIDVFPL